MTPEEIENAAKRLERARNPQWSDDLFEFWWNRDPYFTQHITTWHHFGPGTRKEHVIWEAKQVLGLK